MPAINLDPSNFWQGLESLIDDLTPTNRDLLAVRDDLQAQIDQWHIARAGQPWNHDEYVGFLKDIGYLTDPGEPFQIATAGVDAEIADIAGPQLVVPVSNARFALNAANARWGSLYDALYGTDVIPVDNGQEPGSSYNPKRGAAVIRYATEFLDRTIPLKSGSHSDPGDAAYRECEAFVAYSEADETRNYLFRNNRLHIEIQTNPNHPIGRDSPGNVSDVVLESAVTTIQDCEDSVAAVDAADKTGVYRNWLGLMQGTLQANFDKGGRTLSRELNADRSYTAVDGSEYLLSGQSLMLVRNVGHLMTTDTILDKDGNEVFEGMLDAVVTSACAMANSLQTERLPNSRSGSIYIVKPKMHGPRRSCVHQYLVWPGRRHAWVAAIHTQGRRHGRGASHHGQPAGLCIRAVKDRLVFINTGFLDRTGDEIHTSMHAGAVLPKEAIKTEPWINAYEDWNVDVGIRCGLPGKAQIGKGMWPKPDEMKQMMDSKQAHPEAGRELRLGTIADGSDIACHALSRCGCSPGAGAARVQESGKPAGHSDAAAW